MGLQKFGADIVQNIVLREIERRMFALNNEVVSARKGLRNTLKSWWRKPKEHSGGTGSNADLLYPAHSIESKIRLLADFSFMVQDYETALGWFRMVKDDYKSDQAWLHYASASAMIATCLFVLSGWDNMENARDIEQALDKSQSALFRAETSHSKTPPHPRLKARLFTIAAITTSDIYRAAPFGDSPHLLAASNLLGRAASFEEAHGSIMCAALLKEQQAACLAATAATAANVSGGLRRRFALHMACAGSLFVNSGSIPHALRCFQMVSGVYSASGWTTASSRVEKRLALYQAASGDKAGAELVFEPAAHEYL